MTNGFVTAIFLRGNVLLYSNKIIIFNVLGFEIHDIQNLNLERLTLCRSSLWSMRCMFVNKTAKNEQLKKVFIYIENKGTWIWKIERKIMKPRFKLVASFIYQSFQLKINDIFYHDWDSNSWSHLNTKDRLGTLWANQYYDIATYVYACLEGLEN